MVFFRALSKIVIENSNVDYYCACAIYLTSFNRTAANVLGAWAFWMDVDCGVEKDSAGKGYLTKEIAKQELENFCDKLDLPKPTHIVDSGNGLHVYWILDAIVHREEWQKNAKKLKQLTIAYKLRVDGSRTSDIASVLRIPGTMNNKGAIPIPVKLIEETPVLIKTETMLQSIENAHSKLDVNNPAKIEHVSTIKTVALESHRPTISIVESALKMLDPDCDEATWKLKRIAPLANAAADFPELSDELYKTAKKWSSGELTGTPSVAWSTPGNSNGLTGEVAFENEWKRFLKSEFTGEKANLGTIYYDAKEEGWKAPEEEFTTVDNVLSDEPKDALQAIQDRFCLLQLNGKHYTFDNEHLETSAGELAKKLELSSQYDAKLYIERAVAANFPNSDASKVYKEFFKSPLTTCFTGVEFHPKSENKNYLNLWVGPHRKAKKGKYERITSFLLNVICDGDKASYDYLLRYMAHALQRPEVKPGVMLILLGAQGIGKGTLGRIFQKIWTSTYLHITDIDQVVGNFNASLERAFIVFMDEALFAGDRKSSDALKSLVTEPLIHINEKHQPARQTQSFHRFIVATNATHVKNTEHDDRRDFVLKVSNHRKNDFVYWDNLELEMNTGGIEAFMYELQEIDLAGFNVRLKPSTPALLEQKLLSLDPIARWFYDGLDNGTLDSCSDFVLSGSVNDEGWPDFISTDDALKGVTATISNRSFKKPNASDVLRVLTTICPSSKKGQKKVNDSHRRRGLSLPPLQVAREEFERYIDGSLSWSEIEV